MKFNRVCLAIALAALLAVGAGAQGVRGTGQRRNTLPNTGGTSVPANPASLSALQSDLTSAIQAMEAALPIYDGYRVKSIHAAHRALGIVDRAITKGAAARPASKARDHVPSSGAHNRYSSQQIAQSQANMRQGLTALSQAMKDLQSAAGSNPNKHAVEVRNLLTKAIQDANTAISIHAQQG